MALLPAFRAFGQSNANLHDGQSEAPLNDHDRQSGLTSDELIEVERVAHQIVHTIPSAVPVWLAVAWLASTVSSTFPTATWVIVLVVLAIANIVVAIPFISYAKVRPSRPQYYAFVALIALLHICIGFPSLYLFNEGMAGRSTALLLLAGTIFAGSIILRSSPRLLPAAVLPHAGYLLYLPTRDLLANGYNNETLITLSSCFLLCIALVPLWRSSIQNAQHERRYRHELELRRAEAESAVAAKSAFVAMVSHELRTPISAILAGATALGERVKGERGEEDARLIAEAGNMMRALLNDLLDLAKLDAGRMKAEKVTYDYRQLICDTVKFWKGAASNEHIRLRLRGSRSAPRRIVSDPTRLRQILNNLLSNAIKFAPDGTIVISLSTQRSGHEPPMLCIDVADTGAGMSPEQLARIFNPFDQGGSSIARTHGGTGLGLAISRELAHLMEGDISVRSAVNQGSTFSLTFKAEEPREEEKEVAKPSMSDVTLPSGVRMLLVDDQALNRRAISLMLAPTNPSIEEASSGPEALSLLSNRQFDLVLMDVHMPDLNGLETTKRIRTEPGPNRTTPIIGVTGFVGAQDIQSCFASGMNACVAKPIDVALLYREISNVLKDSPSRISIPE